MPTARIYTTVTKGSDNMAKKGSVYFDGFINMVELSCKAANYLNGALNGFKPQTLSQSMVELHEIEHAADVEKHNMMEKLAKEFVTPIEREDIIELASQIDNVTDKIEDVLIRLYMYNIQTIRPEAAAITGIIVRCCEALKVAVVEFPNFHKSNTLHQAVVDVNSMEEEGDEMYISAMRNLYESEKDAIVVLSWSEMFDRLEDCCDSCEHVANVLESIVMKNS